MKSATAGTITVLAPLICMAESNGEMDLQQGRWRADISGTSGLDAGRRDRSGDGLFAGHVEYEFPAMQHLTFGLRPLPLFIYHQDEGETVYGGGVGYQFHNGWHFSTQFQHVSNAGLGNRNQGVNSVGLGVGLSF